MLVMMARLKFILLYAARCVVHRWIQSKSCEAPIVKKKIKMLIKLRDPGGGGWADGNHQLNHTGKVD